VSDIEQSLPFSTLGTVRVTFGYRPAEVGVVLTTEIPDPSFRVTKIHSSFGKNLRKPHRISLGCNVIGASCPVPDLTHSPSQLAGMTKRVAANMPKIDNTLFRSFKRWVKRFCRKQLTSLIFESTETFGFEEWLSGVPYTIARKEELTRVHKECEDKPVDTRVKAFTKDEDYEDYKHLRGIYSRSDDYKTRVGPFFKKFGDALFKLPFFIKKIPVPQRPDFLAHLFENHELLFCTDFSQFEATFVQKLLSIEAWVYRFSLSKHPEQKHICDLIAKSMSTNEIIFKDFTARLKCKRMSGEMNTSCGNGVMNMLLTLFILIKSGNKLEEVAAIFEGDDGLCGCKILPDATLYTKLGCNIKIVIPTGLHTASFCGNVFDPLIKHNVTNPMEASVRFGWTGSTYLRSSKIVHKLLLKSKALSMLYEYPGCPILRSLANYALRVTHDVTLTEKFQLANTVNTYQREQIIEMNTYGIREEIINTKVHIRTRQLVEELYHISVDQQLKIENYLDNLTTLQPLAMDLPYPRAWQMNDLNYGLDIPYYSPEINFNMSGYETVYYVNSKLRKVFKH
jgi:hypothetical protein